MVLQAYVDPSGKGDPQFLVIAGYIATEDAWANFSESWRTRLDEAGIPYFKMNEWSHQTEIAGWFYRLVEAFDIKAAMACVINTKELVEVEKSIKYPPYITNPNSADNPYYWGFKYIVGTLAQWQKRLDLLEPIDFIFDNDSEQEKIPRAWKHLKAAAAPPISQMMGEMPIYRDDKKTMPLQAADLYAWWVLKWQRENIADWAYKMPFPWEKKKNLKSLSAYFGRKSFLSDISNMLQNLARNDLELQYARSLMPPPWTTSLDAPEGSQSS